MCGREINAIVFPLLRWILSRCCSFFCFSSLGPSSHSVPSHSGKRQGHFFTTFLAAAAWVPAAFRQAHPLPRMPALPRASCAPLREPLPKAHPNPGGGGLAPTCPTRCGVARCCTSSCTNWRRTPCTAAAYRSQTGFQGKAKTDPYEGERGGLGMDQPVIAWFRTFSRNIFWALAVVWMTTQKKVWPFFAKPDQKQAKLALKMNEVTQNCPKWTNVQQAPCLLGGRGHFFRRKLRTPSQTRRCIVGGGGTIRTTYWTVNPPK